MFKPYEAMKVEHRNLAGGEGEPAVRNLFTPEELLATHTGETPEEAEGYGLLDTGTGSMEKVHVTAGVLDSAVNEVLPDGGTNMTAYVLIGGQRYEVKGAALTAC